ncbi:MAG TPA: plastocyanin/azurin family copper-binding protein [Mycobacteriales bacterium]|nr:plastocyanin/azurin family copper-binding protein [Mycobacteriales bacterium]
MPRPALVAAVLLTCVAAAGCTLDSDPAADSLGRATGSAVDPAADAITLGPAEPDAPTIEFFAPIETDFEVTGPTALKPGVVNITLTSEGNHNLALTGPGLPVALLWGTLAGEPENDLTHSVRLREGVYTYYCAVPGHRNAGMVGTIEVNATGTASSSTASPAASPGASVAASPGASVAASPAA